MIQHGHPLMLGADIQGPSSVATYEALPDSVLGYWRTALQTASTLQLPINFAGTQWESLLSSEPYLSLPYSQNPNVWTNGAPVAKVSPFGPLMPWYDVGRQW
jgi:hypothetical protein